MADPIDYLLSELKVLERQKNEAVAREDFTLATYYKVQIETLHERIEYFKQFNVLSPTRKLRQSKSTRHTSEDITKIFIHHL